MVGHGLNPWELETNPQLNVQRLQNLASIGAPNENHVASHAPCFLT